MAYEPAVYRPTRYKILMRDLPKPPAALRRSARPIWRQVVRCWVHQGKSHSEAVALVNAAYGLPPDAPEMP